MAAIKHIAIVTKGKGLWGEKKGMPLEESYKKSIEVIKETISMSIDNKIPVTTLYLLSANKQDLPEFSLLMDILTDFFNSLSEYPIINENKVKIAVIGKWYDLPGRVVDSIKKVIEETKDYDGFFLNLCLNYSGQDEIVDAIRLLARQINAGKIDAESISKEMLKENLYSSYFLPPDLIIINGPRKATSGLLLWDSSDSHIYYTKKLWPDFTNKDFEDALEEFMA